MELIVVFCLYMAYACFSGWRDGLFYAAEGYRLDTDYDPHNVFAAERIVLALMVNFLQVWFQGWYGAANAFVLDGVLFHSFSFFHNGMYYHTRSKTGFPRYHFAYSKEDDDIDSRVTLSFKWRLIGLIGGVVVLGVWVVLR